MVAITDSIKDNTPCRTMKQDNIHQTARIIQWLGGERAGKILVERTKR